MRRLFTLAVLLLPACATSPAGPAPGAGLPVPADAQQATVARHTDGDTLWLRGIGAGPVPARATKVRLLEIDTPELSGPRSCYGQQAASRTAELVPVGARVRVQADRQPRDRYGRLLLYVWTSTGVSLEQTLLQEGYARALLVRPNDRHIRVFRSAEAQARQAGRGLWGRCPTA